MKFNSTTLIIIALLLLVLYLFDNIKSLEESIISNPSVKINYSPRRKYFQDIYFESKKKEKKEEEDKEEKFIGVPVKDIQVLPAVLPTHMPSQSFIKTEKQIVIPSQDKFISGASAPGSTTMVLGSPDKKEKPLFVDNLDRRFNFEFSNIL
jgi:hypothetical protein